MQKKKKKRQDRQAWGPFHRYGYLTFAPFCKSQCRLHIQRADFEQRWGQGQRRGCIYRCPPVQFCLGGLTWAVMVTSSESTAGQRRVCTPGRTGSRGEGVRLLGGRLRKSVLSCRPSPPPCTCHFSHTAHPSFIPAAPDGPAPDYMCILLSAAESDQ